MITREDEVIFAFLRSKSLWSRSISLLVSSTFFLTSITWADEIKPLNSNTLTAYYFSELANPNKDAKRAIAQEVEPVNGRTADDRAEYLKRAITAACVTLLAARVASRARMAGLGIKASPAGIRDEVIEQIRERAKEEGLPAGEISSRVKAAEAVFASPSGTETIDIASARADYRYIGISMGGNKVAVSVNDGNNNIIVHEELRWDTDPRFANENVKAKTEAMAREVMDQTASMIMRLLDEAGVSPESIHVVTAALAGPLDEDAGVFGTPFPTPNLPFENYDFRGELIRRLKEGNISARVIMFNDGKAAENGEIYSPEGLLHDAQGNRIPGRIVITGGGINISGPVNPEAGHNLYQVRGPDGEIHYHCGLAGSHGGHPIEQGNSPAEIIKRSGAMGLAYVSDPEKFVQEHPDYPIIAWNEDLRDFEDRLSGPSIRKRLVEAIQAARESGSSDLALYEAIEERVRSMGREGELERALTPEALAGNEIALRWISGIAVEMGQALAAFIAAHPQDPSVRRLVLVSGVNENMGVGVYESAEDEAQGLDIYMKYIHRSAADELINYFGMEDAADVSSIVSGIIRSRMDYTRELTAYQPSDAEVLNAFKAERLRQIGNIVRRDVLEMIFGANSGHLGGSLSSADILTALYAGGIVRYDPNDPSWENRDRVVLSAGHKAPALYAVLAEAGFFPREAFDSLRKNPDALLQGHVDMKKTPGVDLSTGALGQGFSTACGMAAAARMLGKDLHVWSIIGGGEEQEGQIAEAARHAAALGLANQTVIIDDNDYQIEGHRGEVDAADIEGVWRGYGWDVVIIDGHDPFAIMEAMRSAKERARTAAVPLCIIAKTIKGKGVSEFEKNPAKYHGEVPKDEQMREQALAEIREAIGEYSPEETGRFIRSQQIQEQEKLRIDEACAAACPPFEPIESALKELVPDETQQATRVAFGEMWTYLGSSDRRIVAMSPDLQPSVNMTKFEDLFGRMSPETPHGRYVALGIREAHGASFAGGMALMGLVPAIGTFDIFILNMIPQVRTQAQNGIPAIYIATHAGVSVGEDGATHEGVETPGVMDIISGPNGDSMEIYEPADAEETRVVIYLAIQSKKPVYIRLTRQDVPVIDKRHIPDYEERVREGSYVLRDPGEGANDLIIVATGGTVAHALAASRDLEQERGLKVKVINVVSLNKIDNDGNPFQGYLEDGVPIVTVCDASPKVLENPVLRATNAARKSGRNPGIVHAHGATILGSATWKKMQEINGIDASGIKAFAESDALGIETEQASPSGVSRYQWGEIEDRMEALHFTAEEKTTVRDLLTNPEPILLAPQIADYDWGGFGADSYIRDLLRHYFDMLGIGMPDQHFFAEAWYGDHPGSRPEEHSMVSDAFVCGHPIKLDRLTQALMENLLGRSVYNRYVKHLLEPDGMTPHKGNTLLPILFKISHALKQLSNQVHPNLHWADILNEQFGYPDKNEKIEGWSGIDDVGVWIYCGFRDESSFVDPEKVRQHKELRRALEEASGMPLFTLFEEEFYEQNFLGRLNWIRGEQDGLFDYQTFLRADYGRAVRLDGQSITSIEENFLRKMSGFPGIRQRLEQLQAMSDDELDAILPDFKTRIEQASGSPGFDRSTFIQSEFLQRLRDEAVNIYHNLIHLRKGEFALIPARTPHAIIFGTYGEIQTASDNTLRAANTRKPLDVENLLRIINFTPGRPQIHALPERNKLYPWKNFEAGYNIRETDRFDVRTVWMPNTGDVHHDPCECFEIIVCLSGGFEITYDTGKSMAFYDGTGVSFLAHPLMGKYSIRSLKPDTELIKITMPHSRMPIRQVGEGAIEEFVTELEGEHCRVLTLFDEEVYAAVQQGDYDWDERLRHLGDIKVVGRYIHDMESVSATIRMIEEYNPDRVVVVGSSKIIDYAKYCAAQAGKPVTFIPTVISSNTPYDYRSEITIGPHRIPLVDYTPLPERVVIDLKLLRDFTLNPRIVRSARGIDSKRANRAGAGDIVCIETALWDHEQAVETGRLEPTPFTVVFRRVLKVLREKATHIRRSTQDGLRDLDDLLFVTSRDSIRYGSSQLKSGSEHIVAESIETIIRERGLDRQFMHGEIVGIATLMMAYLQTPEDAKRLRSLRALLRKLGLPATLQEMPELTEELLVEALLNAGPRSDKYTWFDTEAALAYRSDAEGARQRATEAVRAVFDGAAADEEAPVAGDDTHQEQQSPSGAFDMMRQTATARMAALELPEDERESAEAALRELIANPQQPIILVPQITTDEYDWGGRGPSAFLPGFLKPFFASAGIQFPEQYYYAEAWYGSHRGSKPQKRNMVAWAKIGNNQVRLDTLLMVFMENILGRSVYNRYIRHTLRDDELTPLEGHTLLPILFKISEAIQQLSNQVHPNLRWGEILYKHHKYKDANEKIEGWLPVDEKGVWILSGFRDEASLGNVRYAKTLEERTGVKLYWVFSEQWYTERLLGRLKAARSAKGSGLSLEAFLRGDDPDKGMFGDFGEAVRVNEMTMAELEAFLPGINAELADRWAWFNGNTDDELEQVSPGYKNRLRKAKRDKVIAETMADIATACPDYEKMDDDEIEAVVAGFKARIEPAIQDVDFNEELFRKREFSEKIRDEAVNIYFNLIHLRKMQEVGPQRGAQLRDELKLRRAGVEVGEFALIQPRIIHAIVYGVYGEIQTASDTTLRAGNSRKPLDRNNLLKVTNFRPSVPIMHELHQARDRNIPWDNCETSYEIRETDRFEINYVWLPSLVDVHQGGGDNFEMLVCVKGAFRFSWYQRQDGKKAIRKSLRFRSGASLMTHPMMGSYEIVPLEPDTEIVKMTVPHSRMPIKVQEPKGTLDQFVGTLERAQLRTVTLCDREVGPVLERSQFGWWSTISDQTDGRHMVDFIDRSMTADQLRIKMDAIESYNPDYILVVGSRAILNHGRFMASRLGIPVISVPTILSSNTMFSYQSYVVISGEVEMLRAVTPLPERVVIDTGLLRYFIDEEPLNAEASSLQANRAGLGDIICLETALWDWEHAIAANRQIPDQAIWEAHQDVMKTINANVDDLQDMTLKGLDLLANLLYETSENTLRFGSSQVQSGSEHVLSEAMSVVARRKGIVQGLHGFKVILCTLVMKYLQTGDREAVEELKERAARLGLPVTPEEARIPRDDIIEGLMIAEPNQIKWTWFDSEEAQELRGNRRKAEEIVTAVFDEPASLGADTGVDDQSGNGEEAQSPSGTATEVLEAEHLAAITGEVQEQTNRMALRLVAREGDEVSLSKIAVIVNADLTGSVSGDIGARGAVLEQKYRVLEQGVSRVFLESGGVVVRTRAVIQEANRLRRQGYRVVILDNGSLADLTAGAIVGVAGRHYCVVQAKKLAEIDILNEVPYVNINAMAMVGVAVLERKYGLYRIAYKTLTDQEPPETEEEFNDPALWVISLLPMPIPYRGELQEKEGLDTLFRVSV